MSEKISLDSSDKNYENNISYRINPAHNHVCF